MDTQEIKRLVALTNLFNQVNDLEVQEANLKKQLENCQRNLGVKKEEFDKAKKAVKMADWTEWRNTI